MKQEIGVFVPLDGHEGRRNIIDRQLPDGETADMLCHFSVPSCSFCESKAHTISWSPSSVGVSD